MTQFNGVYPISGEDLSALPVRAVGSAIEFYRTVLGFTITACDETTATLQRDESRIGLVRKAVHDPGEAGSCAFVVTDLDAVRKELEGRGLDLGEIRFDGWNGKKYRVCFLREAENGYCFCFSQPA